MELDRVTQQLAQRVALDLQGQGVTPRDLTPDRIMEAFRQRIERDWSLLDEYVAEVRRQVLPHAAPPTPPSLTRGQIEMSDSISRASPHKHDLEHRRRDREQRRRRR